MAREVLTSTQYAFLEMRFREKLPQWLADCERWIGHVLAGWAAHWCFEWDGLPVDETTREFDACLCWDDQIRDNLDWGGVGEGML